MPSTNRTLRSVVIKNLNRIFWACIDRLLAVHRRPQPDLDDGRHHVEVFLAQFCDLSGSGTRDNRNDPFRGQRNPAVLWHIGRGG
jgi:hypothetical protein